MTKTLVRDFAFLPKKMNGFYCCSTKTSNLGSAIERKPFFCSRRPLFESIFLDRWKTLFLWCPFGRVLKRQKTHLSCITLWRFAFRFRWRRTKSCHVHWFLIDNWISQGVHRRSFGAGRRGSQAAGTQSHILCIGRRASSLSLRPLRVPWCMNFDRCWIQRLEQ